MRRSNRRRMLLTLGSVAVLATVIALSAGLHSSTAADHRASGIVFAPAFTESDLSTLPSANWITNGGSTANDRFSELNQINTANVSQLKGVLKIPLGGDGTAAKYSGESQPIVYDGTIYVTTGMDNVRAISATTGATIWEYQAHLNQAITTVCCGWLNRGIALADGMVFFGQLDGKVVALDQMTGQVIWKKQLVHWQKGYTITGAPLYLNGKIYIGTVGAEYETRGFIQAFDAKTGAKIWRFYDIPAPGQPGGNTWPKNTLQYLAGGGSNWGTPAVDANLGLMYITTGNTGDDFYGGLRPGKNLYTDSIVALDLNTGKVKWYFQEVHHDVWDYDNSSPPLLFNTTVNGQSVPGIVAAGKTGWAYFLNRATGKPLYGIVERPVPQNAEQKTWPTQPIPLTGAFIPHTPVSASGVKQIEHVLGGNQVKLPVVVAKQMYTPPSTTSVLIYQPNAAGANNWEPPSYNPDTNMVYICAHDQSWGAQASSKQTGLGKFNFGGGTIAQGPENGNVTALYANSGKVAWQVKWQHACYSGTLTTAGNLVFVGKDSGQYQAYNATTGKLLWGFQTGAGADDVGTVFEQDGQEEVALVSTGNSLDGTPHGNTMWIFGLNGKLGPVPPPSKKAAR